MSNQWFIVNTEGEKMSAIVLKAKGGVELRELTCTNTGNWEVQDHKSKKQDPNEDKLCDELVNAGCDKELSRCIGPEQEQFLPFFKVNPEAKDHAKFEQLQSCPVQKQIEGKNCQKALCTVTGKSKSDGSITQAILQCQDKKFPHTLYYDDKETRWCMSKFDTDKGAKEAGGTEQMKTLDGDLLTSGMPKQSVAEMKKRLDKKVLSIMYRRDVMDELQTERYRIYFDALYEKHTPKFGEPLSIIQRDRIKMKEQLAAIYDCKFDVAAADNPCANLQFNPWAMMQLIIKLDPSLATVEKFADAPPPVDASTGDGLTADEKIAAHVQAETKTCWFWIFGCHEKTEQTIDRIEAEQEREAEVRRAEKQQEQLEQRRRLLTNDKDSTNSNKAGSLMDKPIKLVITVTSLTVAIGLTIASFFVMAKQL